MEVISICRVCVYVCGCVCVTVYACYGRCVYVCDCVYMHIDVRHMGATANVDKG